MEDLYIRNIAQKGRAVFTNSPIKKGETIEFCPVLVIPYTEKKYIDNTRLYDYYFLWGDDQRDIAIALGYGSLYNHEYTPNAMYECYFEEEVIVFKAIRDIEAHEEITISYNQDPDDKRRVWFEDE